MIKGGASQILMRMEAKEMAIRPMGNTALAWEEAWRKVLFSGMESNMQDVAILNDVIFTFDPDQSFFPGCRHGSRVNKFLAGDNLSADESPLHVGVNFPGI